MDAGVDEAWNGDEAVAVPGFGAVRLALVAGIGTGCEDATAFADDDRSDLVQLAGRVDDAGLGETDRPVHARTPWFCERSRVSLTAMPPATPISTCCSLTLCGPSATPDAHSIGQ